MTPGQYVFFCMALLLAAIVLVLIKTRQVEDKGGEQIEVNFTGHEIEGRAMRCAQKIGEQIGLSPKLVKDLRVGLVALHHDCIGTESPAGVGDDFARAAVKRLKKLEAFDSSWDEKEVEATISEIVRQSLSIEVHDTLPVQE